MAEAPQAEGEVIRQEAIMNVGTHSIDVNSTLTIADREAIIGRIFEVARSSAQHGAPRRTFSGEFYENPDE